MPKLPTISESGVPGFTAGAVQGLLAPGGTPKDIVAKLNAAVIKILNTPEMKERLAAQGAEVVGNTPEQFAAFVRDDSAKWAKVVKETGLKIE
jgi:tripartite-type tricarboxylate transporter receptor subunit TctC